MLRPTVISILSLWLVSGAMGQKVSELPEVLVKSSRYKCMYVKAYIRECSTLTTYSDTVFLFREKTVDYMIPPDGKGRYKGWTLPRILQCRSYYRFSNTLGLDSVSDAYNNHFSWSDWVGMPPLARLPSSLRGRRAAADTVRGKYSPSEIWSRKGDDVRVDINVLADTAARGWVPNLEGFFKDEWYFEDFRLSCDYENILGETVSPMDLSHYSYEIESNGRARDMFRFNRTSEPFFVRTHADVYIVDKEYLGMRQARQYEKRRPSPEDSEIYTPYGVPPLEPSIETLVARVEHIDKESIRLAEEPDHRLGGLNPDNNNFSFGNRLLFMLKNLTGITLFKSRKNMKRQWDKFRKRPDPDEDK